MFGVSMPILYPIVLIAMLSRYVTDHIAVCYFYREPPQYDNTLVRKVLKLIRFMVVASLPFAYWQLGNRQIFENKALPELGTRHEMVSSHSLWHAIKTSNPITTTLTYNHGPILLFYCLILYYLIKKLYKKYQVHVHDLDCRCAHRVKHAIYQNLPPFINTLAEWQVHKMLGREDRLREKYGVQTMSETYYQ